MPSYKQPEQSTAQTARDRDRETHAAMNNNPRTRTRTLFPVFTFVVSTALAAALAPAARAGVSTESPFAPRGFGVGAAASNSPIELRGIMSDAQGVRFAIYDPAKKEGAWVGIDEKGQAYVVRSYDADNKRVVVDYQGRSQTLAMADPKFGPSKTTAMMLPGMVPQQPQSSGKSDKANKTEWKQVQQNMQQQGQQQAQPSPAESARLDAIRAEIARRRAQRDTSGGQ